ncbi:MAG: hypothetical protein AAGF68_07080 [Pseudomonadota bacterium]
MSAPGTFHFDMGELPEQSFALETARIVLFVPALGGSEQISLNVDLFAEPREVKADDDLGPYRMQPAYYTEWLTISRAQLRSRGLNALDGYRLDYDEARTPKGQIIEAPGAVQQDSHALWTRATLSLTHLGGARYRVETEGATEFDWTFRIEAEAAFDQVMLRDDLVDSPRLPDPAVEAEFAELFDPALFEAGWKKQGPPDGGWHDYIARPVASGDAP